MPSQATSPQLSVTVLAAVWVSLGRCGVSESLRPGCDNGKLSLDVDLPAAAVQWDCPGSTWSDSTKKLTSVDTVHDPEPAEQICMSKPISYNHTIPNSGAYRPVKAESGEYLYCPPQRWLNNVYHGGIVFLYHPCTPLQERFYLSVLARSCLQDYVITPHPELKKCTPMALVSWGRTLEFSTMAFSDICVWLETTTTNTEIKSNGVNHSTNYNLLLTWPAKQQLAHPEENSTKMKESLRQCCEQTISSLLNGTMETELESVTQKTTLKHIKTKTRHMRAAVGETKGNLKNESESRMTDDVQNHSNMLGPLANTPQRTWTHSGSVGLSILKSDSVRVGASELDKTNPKSESPGVSSTITKQINKASDKHSDKEKNTANNENDILAEKMKDNEVIDVKERELEPKQTHSDIQSHPKSEHTGSNSASKSQPDSPALAQLHSEQKTAVVPPHGHGCEGCKADEHCECSKGTGPEAHAAVVAKGFSRTPRTDEAVWAAGALGFLLVLLTLSVLHTRLYRHWRTMPSLYWHDPQQDYDSVADVIRRRLKIAKRRRKRSRRQEYVLLPSSSSSDEHL